MGVVVLFVALWVLLCLGGGLCCLLDACLPPFLCARQAFAEELPHVVLGFISSREIAQLLLYVVGSGTDDLPPLRVDWLFHSMYSYLPT